MSCIQVVFTPLIAMSSLVALLQATPRAHSIPSRWSLHVSASRYLRTSPQACNSPHSDKRYPQFCKHHHQQQQQQIHPRGATALSAAAVPALGVAPEAAMPVLFTTLLLAAALPVVKALLLSCVGAYAAMKVRGLRLTLGKLMGR